MMKDCGYARVIFYEEYELIYACKFCKNYFLC
jgi:hypothetical protein